MNIPEIIFLNDVLPSVIEGIFSVAAVVLGSCLRSGKAKLISRERIKTINTDGSEIKREVKKYR